VLRVVEQIIISFNWKKHKVDIFLDVAKVFHKAWHQTLLHKLIRIPDRTDKNRSAICKTGLVELLEIGEIRSLERKVTKNTPRFAPVTIRVLYFHSRCTEATTRRRFHNDSLRGRHSNSTTSERGHDHEENRSQDFLQRRKLPQPPTRTLISKDEDAPHRHKRAENYPNRLRVGEMSL
jgi:hypothetical protein